MSNYIFSLTSFHAGPTIQLENESAILNTIFAFRQHEIAAYPPTSPLLEVKSSL